MNITKPNYKGRWPKCSYFGVFDGHGGDTCSNFLKDNMHKYVSLYFIFRLLKIKIFHLNLLKHLN
jgi:serine/threonine protein phosphatase PrpC